ncbi:MAG: hypothetical protein V3U75_12870 [Methylococcaceae bacterium]
MTNENVPGVLIIALLAILALSACAPTIADLSPEHQTRIKERVIPASHDIVFDVVMEMLIERGYKFIKKDKNSGVIETEYRVTNDSFILDDPLSPHWIKIYAHLQKQGEDTTKIQTDLSLKPFLGYYLSCGLEPIWKQMIPPYAYDKWFMLIESRSRQTRQQENAPQ